MPIALQRNEQVETPVKTGGRGQPEVEKILTPCVKESPQRESGC